MQTKPIPRPVVGPTILTRVKNVSCHAMERFREQQPGAVFGELLNALAESVEVAAEIVIALLARVPRARRDPKSAERSTYLLCPERQGLFVLDEAGNLVTYLRLGLEQRAFCEREFPKARR